MRPAPVPACPARRRLATASVVLTLSVLLAACGGAADTASSDAVATETATETATEAATPEAAAEATEEPTADGLAGSEDPVDPEAVDAVTSEPDPIVCDGAVAIVQLIGDASNPDNDDDQIRDAVELMGQTIGSLQDAGADPAIIEAADAVHEQFAVIVDDPTAEPDYAVVEAAGAVLGGVLQSCGLTAEDVDGVVDQAGESYLDQGFCTGVADFVVAGQAFGSSEVGSAEEQAAVADMEAAAFAFADAYGESDPDTTDAMFALYESAQQFLETGETGDVSVAGEVIDFLDQQCIEAGF